MNAAIRKTGGMAVAKSLLCSILAVAALAASPIATTASAKGTIQSFRMPDTPFLPPYTGRIVAGDVAAAQQPDGGIAYSITFETQEQAAVVLDWYKAAFQAYSWNLNDKDAAQYRLCAQHGRNVESNIFLMSPRKPGAKVQVQLYYRYVGREI